jgi:hypothetical protein
MRPISKKVNQELDNDPRMKVCARRDEGNCQGRITREHALIFAGRQLDEAWAILGICAFHHEVDEFQDCGDLNKEKHEWLALLQAPEGRLKELSKAINYEQKLKYLNSKYALHKH